MNAGAQRLCVSRGSRWIWRTGTSHETRPLPS